MKLPKEIYTQHIAVLGKTGSGKTSTAKMVVEQMQAEGARICILDPIKSDWWGLTSSANGQRAGLPFHILGGPRGHVPLHASAGKAIAEIVANGRLPLSIVDMADFAPGGQSQFFVDFAPTLLRKMKGVVYLVIEEAHLFAPKERSGVGQENMAIHWAKMLATAGRSKGVRLILVTQRTQALHNALLGSCETMIVHRLTAPADQAPVRKWLEANTTKDVKAAVESSLSSLKTGTAWVCSGEAAFFEQVSFPRIKTYDNTATPTGKGSDHAVKTSPVDANKLRDIIGDTMAEAEANDPVKLKKQIADLRRQMSAKPAAAADPKAIERAVSAAVAERDRHWKAEATKLERANTTLAKRIEKIAELAVVNGEAVSVNNPPAVVNKTGPAVHNPVHKLRTNWQTSPQVTKPEQVTVDDGPLTDYASDMLRVLVSRHPLATSRGMLATLSHKSAKSSAFPKNLKLLVTSGMATESPAGYLATDQAMAQLGDTVGPPPSGADALQYWIDKLPEYESVLLRAIADSEGLTDQQLSEVTGRSRTSSAFPRAIRNLLSNQFVTIHDGQLYLGAAFTQ